MTSAVGAPDLLAAVVAATRRIVQTRASSVPLREVERRAALGEPRTGAFRRALERSGRINIIAECKRRSPSRGVLKFDYEPARVAEGYERAGAVAISVLTEPTFFDGSLEHLAAVRRTVALPLLRKDFIVDRYQILEARAAGADAVLLIVAALTSSALRQLYGAATDAGLDVLVEIHHLEELPVALETGAAIVGVNNRDLRTLSINPEVSQRAIDSIPENTVAVAESGLKSARDLLDLQSSGYDGFLIGERFMAAADPAAGLAELLRDASAQSGTSAA